MTNGSGAWSADLALAPDAALALLEQRIKQRPRRAFGVLKTANEYVGHVRDGRFEFWERQQRAVHARGFAKGRRGGTRIEAELIFPTRTRVLVVLFFALYVAASTGIAMQPPDPAFSTNEALIALFGAAILGVLFSAAIRRQRKDLRALLDSVYRDVPRI
jgi:membrane associated rhomboid family serine protease